MWHVGVLSRDGSIMLYPRGRPNRKLLGISVRRVVHSGTDGAKNENVRRIMKG